MSDRQCYACQDDPGCHYPDHAKCPEAEIDELQGTIARLASELETHRRGHKRYYERTRLLENAIRDTIRVGERVDTDKLLALRSRVPKTRRKKWGWR